MLKIKRKPDQLATTNTAITKQRPPLPPDRGEHWERLPLTNPPVVFCHDNATLLTIDPGITGTGWALWSGRDFFKPVPPLKCGVITPRGNHWGMKARDLYNQLHDVVMCRAPGWVEWIAVEWPNFRNTAEGQGVAGSGDLGKLFFAASVPLNIALFLNVDASTVSVMEWKGQLPKDVVEKRIRARLGASVCHQLGIVSHAVDAVGVGLYLKGQF